MRESLPAQPTLQCFTTAFLKRRDRYLLIKRASHKKVAPNVWSGVGGNIEPHEYLEPSETCLREVYEETGIPADHIHGLALRYIIVRRAKDVIRLSYGYFGETDVERVIDTDEGTLHWIPERDLLAREYTQTHAAMLAHYLYTPDPAARVVVGVAENAAGKAHMVWSVLEDFDLV